MIINCISSYLWSFTVFPVTLWSFTVFPATLWSFTVFLDKLHMFPGSLWSFIYWISSFLWSFTVLSTTLWSFYCTINHPVIIYWILSATYFQYFAASLCSTHPVPATTQIVSALMECILGIFCKYWIRVLDKIFRDLGTINHTRNGYHLKSLPSSRPNFFNQLHINKKELIM